MTLGISTLVNISNERRCRMLFFKLVQQNQLLAFILLNVLLVDLVQFISLTRKGFAQIVSLAGYYGDRVLIIMILVISSILVSHQVELVSGHLVGPIIVGLYIMSVVVAQRYLPPGTPEDVFHNFFILPVFVIILAVGGIPAVMNANLIEGVSLVACLTVWFVLLLVDIRYDRLDQPKFMTTRGLKV